MRKNRSIAGLLAVSVGAGIALGAEQAYILDAHNLEAPSSYILDRRNKGKRRRSRHEVRGW